MNDAPAHTRAGLVQRWKWLWRALAPLYAATLFTLTHLPPSRLPPTIPVSDKLEHFGAYAMLAAFVWLAAGTFGWTRHAACAPVAFLAIAAFSAIDEVTQPWVGRDASLYDWFADLGGAGHVLLVFEIKRRTGGLVRRLFRRRSRGTA